MRKLRATWPRVASSGAGSRGLAESAAFRRRGHTWRDALVISPWVPAGAVSRTVFDHCSIIKTILTRFCTKANGAIPDMGARVKAANHLGELLSESQARPIARAAYQNLIAAAAEWHQEMVHSGAQQTDAVAHVLTDFQEDFLGAKRELLAARTQVQAAQRLERL
jgi:hypothetical protein